MKNFTRYRALEILELLCGSVLPLIFWVALIFGFDAPYIAILTIISALTHELGHKAAIYLLSNKRSRIRPHASGFRIKRADSLSYLSEIIILLAGPCINLLLFICSLPFRNSLGGYITAFGLVNLATGISNLLPIEGYDGYGAICEIFSALGRQELIKHLNYFSFVVSIGITFVSLYLIERFGEGYWLFGLFFFTVISKLVSFGKYDIFRE